MPKEAIQIKFKEMKFRLIAQAFEGDDRFPSEIASYLGISRQLAYYYLQRMQEAGYVKCRGQIYSLSAKGIKALCS